MNNQFKAQLLKSIATKKKNNEGFTLIELLVVVIIIGVLAAIALPNLLGQVGKAREVEAKNLVGSVNAAQQAYYTQNGAFAPAGTNPQVVLDTLEVNVPNLKFYAKPGATEGAPDLSKVGVVVISGVNNNANSTRDYVGGTAYNSADKSFSTVIGRANASTKGDDFALTNAAVSTAGVIATGEAALNGTTADPIK